MGCCIERLECLCAKSVLLLGCFVLSLAVAMPLLVCTDSSAVDAFAKDNKTNQVTPGGAGTRTGSFTEYINFQDGSQLQYVGTFSPDGRFVIPSRLARYGERAGAMYSSTVHQEDAPPSLLRSFERKIEAFQPPARASASLESESPAHAAMSQIVTFVYGHANVLRMPTNVTTDSTGRTIVADPAANAVHVINPRKRASFRIMGGPNRRLGSPRDVAVDGDDNIYVADGLRATVVVFDRNGRYLREFNKADSEHTFVSVAAVAIDPAARRLYLAEDSQNRIFVLDLEGNVLWVAGKSSDSVTSGHLQLRSSKVPDQFEDPLDIAIKRDELLVLDKGGTRLQVLDLHCKLLQSFMLQRPQPARGGAAALDEDGNVYVSYPEGAVKVFDQEERSWVRSATRDSEWTTLHHRQVFGLTVRIGSM